MESDEMKQSAKPHSRGGARIIGRVLHNRIVQTVLALLVIGGVVAAFLLIYQQARTPIFYNDATLLTLRYPDTITRVATNEDDARAKIIFRATESEKEAGTPFLITIRYEEGLRKVSSMLRYDILDILKDNADKLFPSQYPKLEKIDDTKYRIDDKRAAQTTFTYLSPLGEKIKQRFIILMRDEDMAAYITLQAKEKDFEGLHKKYFTNIISSVKFRLK